jgi:hypothetical protein
VRDVTQLESGLTKNPNDIEIRKRLISHYRNAKLNLTQKKSLLQHQIWFVVNRPEEELQNVFGWYFYYEANSNEYKLLKKEWLNQLEKQGKNLKVVQNAYKFFANSERELAEKILVDAQKTFPDQYEISIDLFDLFKVKTENTEIDEVEKNSYLSKAFESGERAILLLKKERSATRDSKRAELLPQVAEVAIELKNYAKANSYAKELVLEFGDDIDEYEFKEAVHQGNTILGKIALRESNINKAKEYLLISIKAVLQSKKGYLSYPNLSLAKELLEKNEKDVVLEFLKLSEQLVGTDKVSLKKWQNEINNGKVPDFEWY